MLYPTAKPIGANFFKVRGSGVSGPLKNSPYRHFPFISLDQTTLGCFGHNEQDENATLLSKVWCWRLVLPDRTWAPAAMWIWIFVTVLGAASATSLWATSYNLEGWSAMGTEAWKKPNLWKTIRASQPDVLDV